MNEDRQRHPAAAILENNGSTVVVSEPPDSPSATELPIHQAGNPAALSDTRGPRSFAEIASPFCDAQNPLPLLLAMSVNSVTQNRSTLRKRNCRVPPIRSPVSKDWASQVALPVIVTH